MSRKYKFYTQDKAYFVSFSVVYWMDVFTRNIYRDILVDSLNYCIKNKGLLVYSWVIMTNHVHLVMGTNDKRMEDIMRDMKGFSSKKLLKAIEDNPQESRKKWLLWFFERAGNKNPNNTKYQFWQQHNHPIILDKNAIFDQKMNYLHQNPVKAGFVSSPEDFIYSSARDYYTGEKGLVDIELV